LFDKTAFINNIRHLYESSGDLSSKAGYEELCRILPQALPFIGDLTKDMTPTDFAAFTLITRSFDQSVYQLLFPPLVENIIRELPSLQTLGLLNQFPIEDIKSNLLPHIYKQSYSGDVACYLAAELKLSLRTESFPHFLQSKNWSTVSLVNLFCMVQPRQALDIYNALKKINETGENQSISNFQSLLLSAKDYMPIPPNPAGANQGIINELNIPRQLIKAIESKYPQETLKTPTKVVVNTTPVYKKQSKETASFSDKAKDYFSHLFDNLSEKLKNISDTTKYSLAGVIFLLIAVLVLLSLKPDKQIVDVTSDTFQTRKRQEAQKEHDSYVPPQTYINVITGQAVTLAELESQALYKLGELYRATGDYHGALSEFEKALTNNPRHVTAKLQLAYCYLKLESPKEAEKVLNELSDIDPEMHNLNFYMAKSMQMQGKEKEAIAYYDKEYVLHPNPGTGEEYLRYLQSVGKIKEAKNLAEDLAKKFPNAKIRLNEGEGA